MPRTIVYARLHLAALFAAYTGWQLAVGLLIATILSGPRPLGQSQYVLLGYSIGLTLLISLLLNERLPILAKAAQWYPLRAMGWAAVCGGLGLWLGLALPWREAFGGWLLGKAPDLNDFVFVRITCGLGLAIGLLSIKAEPAARSRFFLFDRTHVANREVRTALIAGAVHAAIAAVSIYVIAKQRLENEPMPHNLFLFAGSYVAGILCTSRQKYPQRQMGFVSWSAILATIALVCVWCAPQAVWPTVLLGWCVGLGHLAPRSVAVSSAPSGQRMPALGLLLGVQIAGGGIALLVWSLLDQSGLSGSALRGLAFAAVLATAACSIWFLRRELFEASLDMTLGLNYRIRGYGPGVLHMPTRGPALIIANHHAMIDPLWLSKLVPAKVTALMTAKFWDVPVVSFLVRKVVNAIRVPDSTFRREAPEIQDAIAAIQRGETVMIFPEGWLRRKESMPIRRFGQGAYQILKAAPETPLVACWVEGGWGSIWSFKDAPPFKGKPIDFFRRIDIGVCMPEVLPAEMLDDQHAVRSYMMHKVAEARSYLKLPAITVPDFATNEEVKEEADG
jgi:1-acyl-sn-glycerol-3-phosphate acyltransferase